MQILIYACLKSAKQSRVNKKGVTFFTTLCKTAWGQWLEIFAEVDN